MNRRLGLPVLMAIPGWEQCHLDLSESYPHSGSCEKWIETSPHEVGMNDRMAQPVTTNERGPGEAMAPTIEPGLELKHLLEKP